jgi:hypothetical protein
MACFTQYWKGNTCDEMFADGHEGQSLDHTAGKLFTQRGVGVGDKVYVANVLKGVLILIGRLEVAKIVSKSEAERLLDYDAWDAPEHLIAKPGSPTPMRFKRDVPLEITKQLLFNGAKGFVSLKFVSEDLLDAQTLRGVRRLTEASAQLLDGLLPIAR